MAKEVENYPSLFSYATKELSQDAFFCWLFEWSEEKYKNTDLYKISKKFLKTILEEDIVINKIVIKRQYKFIDFYIVINNNIIISFEDKIKSKLHGNQLQKYKVIMEKKYPNSKKIFVYIKTDLIMEKERSEVEKNEYKIIDIIKLKDILLPNPKNDIYQDYYATFYKKVNSFLNFENIERNYWQRNEWYGFIYKLSNNIKYSFFGDFYLGNTFWFVLEWINNFPIKDVHVTLEIGMGHFLIKFHFYDKTIKKNQIRNEYKKAICELFNDLNINNKNSRLGKSTTFLYFKDFMKYDEEKYLNFEKTVEYIEEVRNRFLKGINNIKQKTAYCN